MSGASDINVEDIMAQIREGIARRRTSVGGAREAQAMSATMTAHIAAETAVLHAGADVYNVALSSHRKGFGAVIVFAKRLLRKLLKPVLSRQVEYNAANARILSALADQVEALRQDLAHMRDESARSLAEDLQAIHDRLDVLSGAQAKLRDGVVASGFRTIHGRVDVLEREHAELRGAVVEPGMRELGERVDRLAREHAAATASGLQGLAEKMNALSIEQARLAREVIGPEIRALEERMKLLRSEQQGVRERVARAERKLRRILHDTSPDAIGASEEPAPLSPSEVDYLGFEERYRGSEEEIKERFLVYVERFKGAASVLDVGCGRGEFLELLREAKIRSKGVDLDLDMVLMCREKGLDVVQADATSHLATLPDESLDGVFASQVIEHMEANEIVRLVQLAHRKLRADGILILETPNPRCLTVFAESFYMDLSHLRPIHPAAAKFLLESTGFRNVELRFSTPVEASARVPLLPVDAFPAGAVEEFNRGLERLNELLYGSQDYAVIGEKIAFPS